MINLRRLKTDDAGWSLAEMLIVLIVGAIILVAAAPALTRALDSYRVVLAAQGIASQLQYARMKAVASNESFRVSFPAGTNQYQVISGATGGQMIGSTHYLPRNITWVGVPFAATSRAVVFLPTGNVPAGGGGSARIQNASGTTISIVVDAGGLIRQTTP